ncbi:MAG: site-specific integrase [Rhodospirillales bacterium]|nr:site-specific integrase [Rhodospirillales bacterium]
MDELAKYPGLKRRKGSANWYIRVWIPDELKAVYGFNEKWVSLRTSDFNDAKAAWQRERMKWDDEFDEKRLALLSQPSEPPTAPGDTKPSRPVIPSRTKEGQIIQRRRLRGTGGMRRLDDATASTLARQWFEDARARGMYSFTDGDREETLNELRYDETLLVERSADGTEWAVADLLLESQGLGGVSGEPAYDALCDYLRRARLELVRQSIDRINGDHSRSHYDHLFAPFGVAVASGGVMSAQGAWLAASGVSAPVVSGLTVGEAMEQFWAENKAKKTITGKTKAKYRAALDLAVAMLGEKTPIARVTRNDAKKFMRLLERLPLNYASKVDPSESLAQFIERTLESGCEKHISRNSRITYFRQFREFMEWAVAEDMIPKLNLSGIKVEELPDDDDDEVARRAFTPEELCLLFASPLFTGCLDDGRGFNTSGPLVPRHSARFWLPLLGLWTGARLGELCQLRAKDLYEKGEWANYIRITDEEPPMSVKTINARRYIPIHPELLRLGFKEFVEERKAIGDKFLFPDMLLPGRYNSYLASKRFNSFLQTIKLKTEDICFHSFRHGFQAALKRAHVHPQLQRIVMGWSGGDITDDYGRDLDAESFADIVANVRYKGLDLSHLYPKGGRG